MRRCEARAIRQRDRMLLLPLPQNKKIREESVCKWGVSGGEESLSTERRQRATRAPARAEARAHVSNRIEAGERLVSLGALRQALSAEYTGAGVALLWRDRHARCSRDRCQRRAARRANASEGRDPHGCDRSATAQRNAEGKRLLRQKEKTSGLAAYAASQKDSGDCKQERGQRLLLQCSEQEWAFGNFSDRHVFSLETKRAVYNKKNLWPGVQYFGT